MPFSNEMRGIDSCVYAWLRDVHSLCEMECTSILLAKPVPRDLQATAAKEPPLLEQATLPRYLNGVGLHKPPASQDSDSDDEGVSLDAMRKNYFYQPNSTAKKQTPPADYKLVHSKSVQNMAEAKKKAKSQITESPVYSTVNYTKKTNRRRRARSERNLAHHNGYSFNQVTEGDSSDEYRTLPPPPVMPSASTSAVPSELSTSHQYATPMRKKPERIYANPLPKDLSSPQRFTSLPRQDVNGRCVDRVECRKQAYVTSVYVGEHATTTQLDPEKFNMATLRRGQRAPLVPHRSKAQDMLDRLNHSTFRNPANQLLKIPVNESEAGANSNKSREAPYTQPLTLVPHQSFVHEKRQPLNGMTFVRNGSPSNSSQEDSHSFDSAYDSNNASSFSQDSPQRNGSPTPWGSASGSPGSIIDCKCCHTQHAPFAGCLV